MSALLAPVSLSHHLAHRPSWTCQHCGRPWPCPAGKGDFAVEFARRPVLLIYYMSACLVEFTADLAELGALPDAATFYPRFITSVRPATTAATTAARAA